MPVRVGDNGMTGPKGPMGPLKACVSTCAVFASLPGRGARGGPFRARRRLAASACARPAKPERLVREGGRAGGLVPQLLQPLFAGARRGGGSRRIPPGRRGAGIANSRPQRLLFEHLHRSASSAAITSLRTGRWKRRADSPSGRTFASTVQCLLAAARPRERFWRK